MIPVPPRPTPDPERQPASDPATGSESNAAPQGPLPPGAPPALPVSRGSFRLFRLSGIDVNIHWSWFVVAYFLIQDRPVPYSSIAWDIAAYVAGFGIILLHEFGHVLACRQVGGHADRIVLWPLGGLAFVAPPPRPGANLWTTAAGPLVNVVLALPLIAAASLTAPVYADELPTDWHHLFVSLAVFNLIVLVFNLLPIFPLDGGRILQALLWKWLGRARALAVAAVVGIIASGGLAGFAIVTSDWWLLLLVAFLVLGGLGGLSYARLLEQMQDAPRRAGLACPNCGLAPPEGNFWTCSRCLAKCDAFTPAGCARDPGSVHAPDFSCPECGRSLSRAEDWARSSRTADQM